MGWPSIEQSDVEVVDWHLSGGSDCLATVRVIRSMYPAAVVHSLLEKDHLNLCFTKLPPRWSPFFNFFHSTSL